MSSVIRKSFSLDAVEDHDLLPGIDELQKNGQLSAVIREALREHFGLRVTANNVLDEVQGIKEQVSVIEKRVRELTALIREGQITVVNGVAPHNTERSGDEIDGSILDNALGRFR